MADNSSNPFVAIYEHVYGALVADTDLAAAVLVGNRRSLQGDELPYKDSMAAADFPMMVLEPGNIGINLHGGNKNAEFEIGYDLYMHTDTLRLDANRALHVLLFRVCSAILKSAQSPLDPAITGVNVLVSNVVNFNPERKLDESDERNRGVHGWVGIFTIVCQAEILRSELIA